MKLGSHNEAFVLLAGDIVLLYLSLYLTLIIRYGPAGAGSAWPAHLIPFSLLFVAWIIIFFISGLYEKHTLFFRKKLPAILLNAQIASIVVAMLFFYLIPYFGINPKTNLFIFLLVSSALIAWWRTKLFVRLGPRHRQPAIIIGHQEEVTTLVKEINENSRYQLEFVLAIDIDDDFDPARRQAELKRIIDERNIAVIVADVKSRKMAELLPLLYRLSFLESRVVFLDIHRVYEEIFDRLPLSVLREDWILENLSDRRHFVYDLTKRGVDIIAGLIMGLLTLLVLPLVWLLIKIEDGGPVWLRQNRLGQHGRDITVYKFRTMKR
ncbi:MAG: sugar transferase, partial [Candidatus Paceibacterota bacterium]